MTYKILVTELIGYTGDDESESDFYLEGEYESESQAEAAWEDWLLYKEFETMGGLPIAYSYEIKKI